MQSDQGFVFEILQDVSSSIFRRNDEVIHITPLGHIGGRSVSLFVALSPWVGHFPDGFELIFSLIVANDDGEDDRIFDGAAAQTLIPARGHRETIRSLLRLSVGALIDAVRPNLVGMTTHTPNLPPAALRKFDEVVREFAARGYECGQTDPYHGRYAWLMRRVKGDDA
jgi:hypothetical protein